MESKWQGMYNHKGFTIWSPNDEGWIAEPDWSIEAIEEYKYRVSPHFTTIAAAKKWINDEGIKLKEEDFL